MARKPIIGTDQEKAERRRERARERAAAWRRRNPAIGARVPVPPECITRVCPECVEEERQRELRPWRREQAAEVRRRKETLPWWLDTDQFDLLWIDTPAPDRLRLGVYHRQALGMFPGPYKWCRKHREHAPSDAED